MSSRKYYLENKRFGKLLVIEYISNGKYRCKCECGNEYIGVVSDLMKGKTKSCGCLKKSRQLDIVGKKFGKLLVLERIGLNKHKHYEFKVLCDCGKENIIEGRYLTSGKTKSCGCGMVEGVKQSNTTHGMSGTRIYGIWNNMRARCYNKNSNNYDDYGGRGITVCNEWKSKHNFNNFFNWAMENGYSDELSIDRINVDGNYEPSNCRWVDMKVQANNRRSNVEYYYNGEYKTLSEICDSNNINYQAVWKRIHKYNWSFEKAISESIRDYR